MLERVLIAGSGGQGAVLTGKLLASVAVRDVAHVTYYPSYGAEVRGGTSHCEVVLSSDEIASPVSDSYDTMILMNQASVDKFIPHATKDTLVIFNSSLCKVKSGPRVEAVDATGLAVALGDRRVANLIMLGAYIRLKGTVKAKDVVVAIRDALKGRDAVLVERNIKAMEKGLDA